MDVAHNLVRAATAPVRIGIAAGELGLSVARALAGEARRVDGSRADGWRRPHPPRVWSPAPEARDGVESDSPAPAPSPSSAAAAEAPANQPPVPPPAAASPAVPVVAPPGAKQVDDEPELIAEFGGADAPDPAGAEIHVDPPWDGYDKLTAAQIGDRLVAADRELAAAVSLYEGMNRRRVSVMRAASRRLSSFRA